MNVNVGTADRIFRAALGVVLVLLPFVTGLTAGSAVLTYGSVVVGLVMLATSAMRICPLYSVLGVKTCR